MRLLCENNISKLYEDGDFYIMKSDRKGDLKISKKEWPVYPLACCLKWDMTPVDIEYLNNLSKELYGA